ncbi:MAG: hypothetical protein IT514_07075 [Burkholderiales bacterium]|nr:hypothetical protein [Burkholderiales bacterium]
MVWPRPQSLAPLAERYRQIWERHQPADARYLESHRGHRMYFRPEEADMCTAELIRATILTATRAELRERLRSLRDAGYSHVAFDSGYGHPDVLEEWIEVIEGL